METVVQSFEERLVAAQKPLFAFIYTMVGNTHVAQDILQDTNLKLLTVMEKYDPARPFFPWARAFAFNQIRTHLKRETRCALVFSDELVEQMAEELAKADGQDNALHFVYLDECLSELDRAQRTLITAFYYDSLAVPQLARLFKRSESTIYVQLHRLRTILKHCITHKILNTPKGAKPC